MMSILLAIFLANILMLVDALDPRYEGVCRPFELPLEPARPCAAGCTDSEVTPNVADQKKCIEACAGCAYNTAVVSDENGERECSNTTCQYRQPSPGGFINKCTWIWYEYDNDTINNEMAPTKPVCELDPEPPTGICDDFIYYCPETLQYVLEECGDCYSYLNGTRVCKFRGHPDEYLIKNLSASKLYECTLIKGPYEWAPCTISCNETIETVTDAGRAAIIPGKPGISRVFDVPAGVLPGF